MSRTGWPYGSAVVDGVPQYFSPSALMTADPDSESGCLRKWWFTYIAKIKEPPTKAQAEGIALHSSIEDYLLNGKKEELSQLALPGLPIIPEPGPDLKVEWDIAGGALETAPLRVRGVPIAGYIDLVHQRGTNKGGSDISDTRDPVGTVEVIDWKTSGNPKYIKSPKEMASTLQMTAYGKWATTVWPDTEWVRLSHGYFITKGKNTPKKVSLRVHRDQIDQRWKHIDKLAGYLIDVAKETNPDKVPGNARACEAYRGCFHRDHCSFAMHNSLDDLGGPLPQTNLEDLGYQKPQGEIVTSLLARIKNKNAPEESKKPSATDVAAEKMRLAKEEVLARWPGLDQVLTDLEALGLGMPQLSGEAAKAYATLNGLTLSSDALAGSGTLGQCSFNDPAELPAVLAEAKDLASGNAPAEEEEAPAAILPPDAPSAKTVAVPAAVDAAIEAAAAEPTKKKGGRPKKVVDAEPVVETQDTTVVNNNVTIVNSGANEQVFIYVDALPSVASESLWPLVNSIVETLSKKHGADDIRCAPNKDSSLAFGGWKGILAHALRLAYPKIPAGHHVLDGAASETGQVVAETMRDLCHKHGGVFVRGTR